jgi:resuscitation-promoting factor RpfA
MAKSPDAFRTISEVAEWLDVPAHVLRFWESRFTQVKPVKRAGGRRYYRPADMELLGGIKRLLHDDGVTIRGVQKILREEGVRHVAGLSMPLRTGAASPELCLAGPESSGCASAIGDDAGDGSADRRTARKADGPSDSSAPPRSGDADADDAGQGAGAAESDMEEALERSGPTTDDPGAPRGQAAGDLPHGAPKAVAGADAPETAAVAEGPMEGAPEVPARLSGQPPSARNGRARLSVEDGPGPDLDGEPSEFAGDVRIAPALAPLLARLRAGARPASAGVALERALALRAAMGLRE